MQCICMNITWHESIITWCMIHDMNVFIVQSKISLTSRLWPCRKHNSAKCDVQTQDVTFYPSNSTARQLKTGTSVHDLIVISLIYYRFIQITGKGCEKKMPGEKRWLCGSCAPQMLEAQNLGDAYRSVKSEIRLSMTVALRYFRPNLTGADSQWLRFRPIYRISPEIIPFFFLQIFTGASATYDYLDKSFYWRTSLVFANDESNEVRCSQYSEIGFSSSTCHTVWCLYIAHFCCFWN